MSATRAITLPHGLLDGGRRRSTAELRLPTGADEARLLAARERSRAEQVTALLARCVDRIDELEVDERGGAGADGRRPGGAAPAPAGEPLRRPALLRRRLPRVRGADGRRPARVRPARPALRRRPRASHGRDSPAARRTFGSSPARTRRRRRDGRAVTQASRSSSTRVRRATWRAAAERRPRRARRPSAIALDPRRRSPSTPRAPRASEPVTRAGRRRRDPARRADRRATIGCFARWTRSRGPTTGRRRRSSGSTWSAGAATSSCSRGGARSRERLPRQARRPWRGPAGRRRARRGWHRSSRSGRASAEPAPRSTTSPRSARRRDAPGRHRAPTDAPAQPSPARAQPLPTAEHRSHSRSPRTAADARDAEAGASPGRTASGRRAEAREVARARADARDVEANPARAAPAASGSRSPGWCVAAEPRPDSAALSCGKARPATARAPPRIEVRIGRVEVRRPPRPSPSSVPAPAAPATERRGLRRPRRRPPLRRQGLEHG